MRDFNEWIKGLKHSISTFKYYVDFDKVYDNVESIKIELNILNSLIGSKNIENDFRNILNKYPNVLKAIPILIAKRENEIYCQDENIHMTFNFKNINNIKSNDIESIVYFMKATGLFDLLENHLIHNLVDYVTGVEVGLDSNGRKNRGGHLMEDLVERYLKDLNVEYYKEMYLTDVEKKYLLDLSSLSNTGKTEKRFDFVFKANDCVYAIECNFYTGSGSKLNETARSYKMIALEAKNIQGFKFVWITDGKGWLSAKHNLEETFDVLDDLYSIKDLEEGILEKIIKK